MFYYFSLFQYAEGPLLDGLHWENYYNGKAVKQSEKGYIYFENKLLGLPRLRQVRVLNTSCEWVTFSIFFYANSKRSVEFLEIWDRKVYLLFHSHILLIWFLGHLRKSHVIFWVIFVCLFYLFKSDWSWLPESLLYYTVVLPRSNSPKWQCFKFSKNVGP